MFEEQEQEQEQEHVHTHTHMNITIAPNKQEFYITVGWKGFSVVNTLAYWAPL